jgi:hypothetical protein
VDHRVVKVFLTQVPINAVAGKFTGTSVSRRSALSSSKILPGIPQVNIGEEQKENDRLNSGDLSR